MLGEPQMEVNWLVLEAMAPAKTKLSPLVCPDLS